MVASEATTLFSQSNPAALKMLGIELNGSSLESMESPGNVGRGWTDALLNDNFVFESVDIENLFRLHFPPARVMWLLQRLMLSTDKSYQYRKRMGSKGVAAENWSILDKRAEAWPTPEMTSALKA